MHANDTDVLVHMCGTSAHSERSQVRCTMVDGADVETSTLGTAASGPAAATCNDKMLHWLLFILLGWCIAGTALCTLPFTSPAIEFRRRLDLVSNDTVAIGYNLRTMDGLRAAFFNDQRMLSVLTTQNSTLDYMLFSPNKYCLRRRVDETGDMTYFVSLDMQQTGILFAPAIHNMSEIAVAFRATWHVIDPVRFATSVPGAVVNALEPKLTQYVGDALRHGPSLTNVSVAQFEQAFGVEINLVPVFTLLELQVLYALEQLTHGL